MGDPGVKQGVKEEPEIFLSSLCSERVSGVIKFKESSLLTPVSSGAIANSD
ncbi:hypothetical protein [Microcoleus sp. bin38.metabat.b11b12b14.051]|uniref:hypothetical protein n=1 Tax=Microcoleus sp. bin38.metabat.b11b12b14.051 TaxID=2742709 RepID=UPI002600D1C0|nr:hypothetical protein [Microcoleus sp. bin38.metabat.b11b12b14.051]